MSKLPLKFEKWLDTLPSSRAAAILAALILFGIIFVAGVFLGAVILLIKLVGIGGFFIGLGALALIVLFGAAVGGSV